MQVRSHEHEKTIKENGYIIKITARAKIPKKIITDIRHVILKKEEELFDWIDVKKELKKKQPDIDSPGVKLRIYRELNKLSQRKLAQLSSVSQGRISDMEKGKRGIGVIQAKKLAKNLKIDYKKFL